MGSERSYAGAWKDGTLSFFDHIPALCLLIIAPAVVLGVIVHASVDGFSSILVVDSISTLILVVPGLAAALQMSRDESFYRPGLPPITQTLITRIGRLLVLGLVLTLALRPLQASLAGIFLAAAALWLLHPVRWLEGGRLWADSGGRLRLVLAALPLWLLSPVVLWGGIFGVVWSTENSTPLMCGLAYVLRGLAFVWCWTVLLRLYRVRDARAEAQAQAA